MTIIPQEASPLFCVGEITVEYNANPTTTPRQTVTTSKDAYQIFRQYWTSKINRIEEFYVMCLNTANEVLGIYLVSTGGVSGTYADPKIVFQVALGCNASRLIVAHNHPSGNMQASEADKKLTSQYKTLGSLMVCPLLDHLILGPQEHVYYSFADEGIL